MSHVRFDPAEAVTFDLAHGLVHLEGAPSRLLVPADALAALCASAGGAATEAFGRALGAALGRRAAHRLAGEGGVRGATIEGAVEHLGGEMALVGLGSASLERWGRALVWVMDQSPLGVSGDGLLAAALAGAITAAVGREVHAVLLAREGVRARFLITGAAGAAKVRAWLAAGVAWGDALVRLHAGAGGEA
jgi:hypothetical protein